MITPAVERLRDGLGYPGMAILQYHFDPDPHSPHNLANHRSTRSSTRAPTTTTRCCGWYRSLPGGPPRAGRRADRDAATTRTGG